MSLIIQNVILNDQFLLMRGQILFNQFGQFKSQIIIARRQKVLVVKFISCSSLHQLEIGSCVDVCKSKLEFYQNQARLIFPLYYTKISDGAFQKIQFMTLRKS